MKGILLIALGDAQYGRMAANLASSIRYTDKDIQIHLVHSGSSLAHLTEEHKKLFNSFSECPSECYTKNGKVAYLKAKTFMYDLSPFETTLFLDVDMVWFPEKKVSKLFDELKDVDFTMQNRGNCSLANEKLDENFSMWCNIKEVKQKYNATGKFYQLASEMVYYKKTDKNKAYFDFAKSVFDEPKVNTIIKSRGRILANDFGGNVPDELAFDIASAVHQHYPHRDNFVPVFWHPADKKIESNAMIQGYYGYSIGGNTLPEPVKNRYIQLCRFYAKELGLPFHYAVHPKRQWLPERRKI